MAASSKKSIPGTMSFSLRTPTTEPVVRRPTTACESCRASKVKCNGKQPCQRCTDRAIPCVHAQPSIPCKRSIVVNESVTRPKLAKDQHNMVVTETESPPDSIQSNLDGFTYNGLSPVHSQNVPWFDDTSMSWTSFDGDELLSHLPQTADGNDIFSVFLGSTPNQASERGSPDRNPPDLLHPMGSSHCQCRTTLVAFVPILEKMIQQGSSARLDQILKTTEDVTDKCQEILQCPKCPTTPVGLVCVAHVFQQTGACFEYVSRSGLDDTTTKIGLGDYQVSVEIDKRVKRMLILNVLEKGNAFLDALRDLVRKLCMSLSSPLPPVSMDRTNLVYVRDMIFAFKPYLKQIGDALSEEKESVA